MDEYRHNLFEDFKILLEIVDKTGLQHEGEFAGMYRDPEIHAIACKWLEIIRQKIMGCEYNNR